MNKYIVIILLVAQFSFFSSCNKQQDQLPIGRNKEKLLSVTYDISYWMDSTTIDEGVDLRGTSTLITDYPKCSFLSILHFKKYGTLMSYPFHGIGFSLNFEEGECPDSVSKSLTDQWFQEGKVYSIGENANQIEISLNKGASHTGFDNAFYLLPGRTLQEDNSYGAFFTIISTEEYEWLDYQTIKKGKLVTAEFECTLRRTEGEELLSPSELIQIKNGRATFYVEYTD